MTTTDHDTAVAEALKHSMTEQDAEQHPSLDLLMCSRCFEPFPCLVVQLAQEVERLQQEIAKG